jgi:hypothetical protein
VFRHVAEGREGGSQTGHECLPQRLVGVLPNLPPKGNAGHALLQASPSDEGPNSQRKTAKTVLNTPQSQSHQSCKRTTPNAATHDEGLGSERIGLRQARIKKGIVEGRSKEGRIGLEMEGFIGTTAEFVAEEAVWGTVDQNERSMVRQYEDLPQGAEKTQEEIQKLQSRNGALPCRPSHYSYLILIFLFTAEDFYITFTTNPNMLVLPRIRV